jgi:glycerophosphoryl diester phosphodiesterase
MKVAILQPPYPDKDSPVASLNCINWIEDHLEALVGQNIEIVVLPEYSNCPGIEDAAVLRDFISKQGKEFTNRLSGYAVKLNCTIIAGLAEEENGKLKNRATVFSPDGKRIYYYDKLHLTSAESEMGFEPGGKIGVFDFNGLKLGFAICFDVYFPEYAATLAGEQIDIMICPTYQRSEEADRIAAMTRTRAIDSGAWILRSSYSISKDSPKGGRSMIVSPAGKILADAGSEPGVKIADFNPKDNYIKPASFGRPPVIHRDLMESKRRPGVYRSASEKRGKYMSAPFPRLCAHRGLSFAMPENSIPAFAAAIACGAHEIEFDLWLSADGVPVVCHDPDLNRVAGVDMVVTESSWENISKIDLGAYKGPEWAGIKIPRFEEILNIADGSFGMNIHIKAPGKDGILVQMVGDLLREHCLLDNAYIAGDEDVLEAALSLSPDVSLDCLADQGNPDNMMRIAKKYDCQRVQFYRQISTRHIAQAAEAGIISNLFYSDEYSEAMEYVDQGIDVVLTNKTHQLINCGFNSLLK